MYLNKYPLEVQFFISSVLFFSIFSAIFLFKKNSNSLKYGVLLIISGIFHFIAYSNLNVPPYHWYYAPSTSLVLIGLAFIIYSSIEESNIIINLFFISLLILNIYVIQKSINSNEMPIHTNWTSRDNYRDIAEKIDRIIPYQQKIIMHYEIGSLAYFSNNAIFLDEFSHRTNIIKICDNFKEIKATNSTSIIIKLSCLRTVPYPDLYIEHIEYTVSPSDNNSSILKVGPFSSKWTNNLFLYLNKN